MPDEPDLSLSEPAAYFPLARGRFTVSPGLMPLSAPFGNGPVDHKLFQIDRDFAHFRANTVAARAERLEKYVLRSPCFDRLRPAVCGLIAARLSAEYPGQFELQAQNNGGLVLSCRLTGERLIFDSGMRLTAVESSIPIVTTYQDAFDALISQVPEDVAVVELPEGASDENVALHVTAPSHWSPEEKIGASFLATHAPVPGFGRIGDASGALLEKVLGRPPVVRFNWGIEFSRRLNLHPESPPGADIGEWNRRHLRLADECPVFLRIERQVLWGMPDVRALLFTIRVYVRPVDGLTPAERSALRDSLLSMPEESRAYKGLQTETYTDVVNLLSQSSG